MRREEAKDACYSPDLLHLLLYYVSIAASIRISYSGSMFVIMNALSIIFISNTGRREREKGGRRGG